MHDYKSLCPVVMICATLVNTQTHTDVLTAILYAQPDELNAVVYNSPAIFWTQASMSVTVVT